MSELMSMDAVEREGAVLWTVQGEIDLSSAPDFERKVLQSATGLVSAVVVDLAKVRYLDSAGLASLVRLHLQMTRHGSPMRVVVGERTVARSTIELAALDQVLALYETLDAALVS